jgi:gamma-glutamylcyclotransferase (GGCT)/AIG2-like uncharacterized protein YtfP
VNADRFFVTAQEGDTVTVVTPGRPELFGYVYDIDSSRSTACLDNLADAQPYALLLEFDSRRGTDFRIHPRIGGDW